VIVYNSNQILQGEEQWQAAGAKRMATLLACRATKLQSTDMTTAGQAPGEGFTTAEDEWRPAVGAMHLGGSAAGTMHTPGRNTTWNPSQETDPAFWRRECRGSGKMERPPSSLLIWALV
jgi:hypothetical protein